MASPEAGRTGPIPVPTGAGGPRSWAPPITDPGDISISSPPPPGRSPPPGKEMSYLLERSAGKKTSTPMFTDTHRVLKMMAQDVELVKARAMRVDSANQAAIQGCRKELLEGKAERVQLAHKFVDDMHVYMDGKCSRVMRDVQEHHQEHHADDFKQQLPLNNMSDDVERLWESLREVANAMNNMIQDTLDPELQVMDPSKSIPPDHPMYSFRGSIYSEFLPELMDGGAGAHAN